ncbi:hypothetical protein AMATHDRAFT_139673 [Amanita thiersii Skay4041]|uniref:holo-[acyl-carrier-protein] synthase n=1 Tax=Amanita thiersii Skay4041 TaxID=703135 RepID=A0A2A9NXN1_9AGAR|nr:hypothetical protein AMATHDRAFT_139673 [Amanita thiersii Skay4041]
MEVWVVIYNPETFSEELYRRALLLVDDASAERIKKYYRREDACRCLIGRLLPRALLHNQGVEFQSVRFATTERGKPYIAYPELTPPIGYNITHDNAVVAMAFSPGTHNPPAYLIGIDIMRVHLPGRDTFTRFVKTMCGMLTPFEYGQVFSGKSEEDNLRCFFWIWTMKEAYTKALGLGLGFDFARVEFDSTANVVRVDGKPLTGWRFVKFKLHIDNDDYQGVVAEYVGIGQIEIIQESAGTAVFMKKYEASAFVQTALSGLDFSTY